MEERHAPATSLRDLLKSFMLVFVPAALLVALVSATIYFPEAENARALVETNERLTINQQRYALETEIRGVTSDLLLLTAHQELSNVLASPKAEAVRRLTAEFLAFAEHKRVYDQIRFLDTSGHEVVRVNYNNGHPRVVPEAELQDKSDRYYFIDTITLGPGEVFVSPFDLNVENGQVERPFRPTIRFGTPVFDDAGNKRGIMLVNYNGTEMLEMLGSLQEGHFGDVMLVNRQGYFMRAPSPAMEWGFMFEEGAGFTLQNHYPTATRIIQGQEQGQVLLEKGLFTFNTVSPVLESLATTPVFKLPGADTEKATRAPGDQWKLVSFVPQAVLAGETATLRNVIFKADLALLIIIAAVAWTQARAWSRRRQAEAQLLDSELRYSSVTESVTDAILSTEQDGRILFWNRGATQVFGYGPEEMIGKPVTMLLPKRYRHAYWQQIHKLKHSDLEDEGKPVEFKGLNKDGAEFPMDFTLTTWHEHGRTFFTGVARDITERKKMEQKLEQLAVTDGLTGLFNRAYFDRRLTEECAHATRYKSALTLLVLDVDHFKSVNDDYGHQAGDRILAKVADVLVTCARKTDIVARYGGEEFVMILPHTAAEGAMILAERIRKRVAELHLEVGAETVSRTISIGAAQFDPQHHESVEVLFECADQALYNAKEGGRDKVVLAPSYAPEAA